eukprot:maker-scaffold380_size190731-snap-gene-0.37 protein:Tk02441 transcript:maker-scaffold380_size190731-snap-gene-0.37-mRNA-1 annotation:"alpha- -mannosyltransferase alg9"
MTRSRHSGTARPFPRRVAQHVPTEVIDEDGVPYVVGAPGGGGRSEANAPWCPGSYTAFKILIMARLSSAVWSHIGDCDETFNYWEPLHFLLFGRGFQTWEYSPVYGLRSYAYLLLHVVPAWIYDRLLTPHPVYVFFFLRCVLALVSSGAEVYFVRGIRHNIGPNVARLTLALLALSTGMFVSSSALLPASTSMSLNMLAMGAWMHRHHELAIFFTAMSTFLSWPFAAILGLPIALDILFRRGQIALFLRWCLISVVTLLVPQVLMDTSYYGQWVIAPWNIVTYNVFTPHGPDLYGVSDVKYYLVNGFLNFNVAFILSLIVWPVLAISYLGIPRHQTRSEFQLRLLQFLGFHLWLVVFFVQPHKEERFLYPIYPLIAWAAATTIDGLQKLYFLCLVSKKNRHYLDHTGYLSILILGLFSTLSLSRNIALHKNYGGAFNAWIQVSHMPFQDGGTALNELEAVHVCVGKEWHRFPNSFFLPAAHWELKFLRSEFRGQLPQPFPASENATSIIRSTFNDQNLEEMDRYVSIDTCHIVVDLDTGKETVFEPNYSAQTDIWQIEESFPFVDNDKSSGIFKAFFVPFLSQQQTFYHKYNVLKRKKM